MVISSIRKEELQCDLQYWPKLSGLLKRTKQRTKQLSVLCLQLFGPVSMKDHSGQEARTQGQQAGKLLTGKASV